MPFMNKGDSTKIAIQNECKSDWMAFNENGDVLIERDVRACFASLNNVARNVRRIDIFIHKYDPDLGYFANCVCQGKTPKTTHRYTVTDLLVSQMREILALTKDIVDFEFAISSKHITDENNNGRTLRTVRLMFPDGTNLKQMLFVCTVVRWFYESENRYVALKAFELYNTEEYHRFGFFNMYCLVKACCHDIVNSAGHDLLNGKIIDSRRFNVPERFKSIYEMRSMLSRGKNITKLWDEYGNFKYAVDNVSDNKPVYVSKFYCNDARKCKYDTQEMLEQDIDFIISKIKDNETFNCTNEES